jgi:hypothetical protein
MAKTTRPVKTRSPKKAAPRAAGKTATAAKKSLPKRSRSASIALLINRYNALTIRNNTGVTIKVTLTTPANQSYSVSPSLANNGIVTVLTNTLAGWLGNVCDDIVISYQALNNTTAIVDATNRFCFDRNALVGATYRFASPAPGSISFSSP